MAVHAAAEQALTRSVATANPKNYQLWNYRRRLSLALGPPQAEEVGWRGMLAGGQAGVGNASAGCRRLPAAAHAAFLPDSPPAC